MRSAGAYCVLGTKRCHWKAVGTLSEVTVRYRRPGVVVTQVEPLTTAEQLRRLADELVNAYRAAGRRTVPGLTLNRGPDPDDPLESIAIGATAGEWAMIHTDGDFNQRRTEGKTSKSGSIEVDWGQPDSVPCDWFIPVEDALPALRTWLTEDRLDQAVFSSTECF